MCYNSILLFSGGNKFASISSLNSRQLLVIVMHGIIFSELKKFVNFRSGEKVWDEILYETGIGFKHYLPIQEYPDHELMLIIDGIARKESGTSIDLLEQFGEFIVPSLMGMYKTLIKREWRTLDLLEHTEETIHSIVRLKNPGSSPPDGYTHP